MSETAEELRPQPDNWINWWKAHLLTPWSVVIGAPIAVLVLDQPNFLPVLIFAIKAFISTLPYILFAVLMVAWLKSASADALVANAFKGREIRMIFLAALFGGLAPFCSCEVIPFIAGLLALGVPLSAVMAFWLSSPLIDPPTVLITAAALGWPFAIGKTITAVMLGLFGGFSIKLLANAGLFSDPLRIKTTSCCGCETPKIEDKPHWRFWDESQRLEQFKSEFVQNGVFLIKWLALAYVLEALLVTYVPSELIVSVVGGDGLGAITLAAFVGMPAYLNGYVAPPMVAGLVEQGMSTGAAMSFIVAGAVSSIPAMAAVWSLVKPGVFASYMALGVTGAILSGALYQAIV